MDSTDALVLFRIAATFETLLAISGIALMSDHSHGDHGHAATATAPLDALRFEKQELQFFDDEDRAAGVAIGRLLAFFFCILLTLMVSVTVWMCFNENASDDPQAGVGAAYHTNEH